MAATTTTVSTVDPTTIQIRFELGEIDGASYTTEVPNLHHVNPDDGYAFDAAGNLLGRVRGKDGQFFVPMDTLTPSSIEDIFTWTETDGTRSAPVDRLDRWTVLVDGVAVDVTAISRKANILDTANVGWELDYTTAHNVFLELAAPLPEGAAIEIRFDDPDFTSIVAAYDPVNTVSEAIHVSLPGFDPDDLVKTAYLSSWNGFEYIPGHERGGEGRPQDYAAGLTYEVVDEGTGTVVLTGETVLAQPAEVSSSYTWPNYALTDVYQMDLSALTAEGTYHIRVDGVGRSQSFDIDNDHWGDLFDLSFRGFYHQRSGIALEEPYTDWVRPRALHPEDGIVVHQTTVQIIDTSEAYDGSLPKPFEFWEGNLTGEILTDAWGGWHDAGDFDRRTQHLFTTRKLIELHEMQTDWSDDLDARIPESGDAIPDLLDEAIWGASVFRRLQHEDGGVPGGIESASYGSFGDSSFTDQRELYVYAPDVWTSWEYAGAAAKIARALAPYDPAEAQAWLDSAKAAFAWAEARIPPAEDYDNGWLPTARNIAAAELWETTGDTGYAEVFAETFVYNSGENVEWYEAQYEAAYVIASSDNPDIDPALKQAAFDALKDRADWLLAYGATSGFGAILDPYAPYGWGNTATQPTTSADFLIRMHALTGDDAYLAPVYAAVDYALGANPMNMSFLTGLDRLVPGVRQPEEILHGDMDVLGAAPPPGITVYGELAIGNYGWNFYHSEMWEETWPNYYDAPVHESWNGAYTFVPVTEFTVMQGMKDMAFVLGYLAALESDGASGGGGGQDDHTRVTVTDEAGTKAWDSYTDTFDSTGTRILREMTYDDGRLAETTYQDGVRKAQVLTDPQDAKTWSRIETGFDDTGQVRDRTTTQDDGRVISTTYVDGKRAEVFASDVDDQFVWASKTSAYDATGARTSHTIAYDDGRILDIAYLDGVKSKSVMTDGADIHDWDSYTVTFGPDGNRISREIIYDDGSSTFQDFG